MSRDKTEARGEWGRNVISELAVSGVRFQLEDEFRIRASDFEF